jgi:GTP-binding protein HflX
MRDEHKAEVEKVLGELGVLSKPRLEIWNKIDLLPEEERAVLETSSHGSSGIPVSARTGQGIGALLERVDAALTQDPIVEQKFQIPQSEGEALAALGAGAVIRDRQYNGNLVMLTVAGPESLLGRYRRFRRNAERAG